MPDDAITNSRSRIKRIAVGRLFGVFDYKIEVPVSDSALSRLVLLYGDNGCGKTTLLELLFHLLSPSDSNGHRTAIGDIAFEWFEVQFSDQSSIRLERSSPSVGEYKLILASETSEPRATRWTPDGRHPPSSRLRDMRQRYTRLQRDVPEAMEQELSEQETWEEYLRIVDRFRPAPLYLADDRVLYSDEFQSKNEDHHSRTMRMLISSHEEETPKRAVTSQLRDAISRANEYLQAEAIGGTSTGSSNANQLYLDVLGRLSDAPDSGSSDHVDLPKRIDAVSQRAEQFNEFGLSPALDADAFKQTLQGMSEQASLAARTVLVPHLESLEARMNALQDVEAVIRTFVSNVNSFLTGKHISFSPQSGLTIRTRLGETLAPDLLSSGEKQIVLLLCNALLARQGSGLFLIDEPEISLNVKWQRKLLPAFLACTEGTDVQFIVATHSLELISGHRQSLARLAESHVLG